jgi:streptogramin lyase
MQATPKYPIGHLSSRRPGPAPAVAAAAVTPAPIGNPAAGPVASSPVAINPIAPSLTYKALAILPQLVGLNEQLRRAEQAARQGDPERARQALSRLEALANEGWLHLMQQEQQEQAAPTEPRT